MKQINNISFELTIVGQGHVRRFVHKPTRRRFRSVSHAGVLSAAKIELIRAGKMIDKAEWASAGGHCIMYGWRGEADSPLIGKGAPGDSPGWNTNSILPGQRGLREGDILRITSRDLVHRHEIGLREKKSWRPGTPPKIKVTVPQLLDRLKRDDY